MSKKRSSQPDKKYIILLISTILLGIISVTLLSFLVYTYNLNKSNEETGQKEFISLGAMKYKIENDRATLRNDASARELQAFLEEKAQNERCGDLGPVHLAVKAHTKDETQVLLGYGCGSSEANMHLTKTNTGWKSISPTDNFGAFGIPECGYLEENVVSKEIAPVCFTSMGSIQDTLYTIR